MRWASYEHVRAGFPSRTKADWNAVERWHYDNKQSIEEAARALGWTEAEVSQLAEAEHRLRFVRDEWGRLLEERFKEEGRDKANVIRTIIAANGGSVTLSQLAILARPHFVNGSCYADGWLTALTDVTGIRVATSGVGHRVALTGDVLYEKAL